MILNFHVLRRWVDEIQPRLKNARILEAYSQSKDVLHIICITPERQQEIFELACSTRRGHVVLRASHQKRRKNTASLFSDISGLRITDLHLQHDDRVMEWHMSDGHRMVFELFGGMNAILVDVEERVVDAFQNARLLIGGAISRGESQLHTVSTTSEEAFCSALPTSAHVKEFLAMGGQHFSKPLIQEVLFEWTSEDPRDAYVVITRLLNRMRTEPVVIYSEHEIPTMLSPCRLMALELRNPGWEYALFSSLNDAIENYLKRRHAADRRAMLAGDIQRVCRNRIRKNNALLRALADDRTRALDFEQTERNAHLLSANLFKVHKGMDRVQVEDWLGGSVGVVEIAINPELTPAENVAHLFTSAKKMKAAIRKLDVRMVEVEDEIRQLSEFERLVGAADTHWKAMEQIHTEFIRKGWIQDRETATRKEEPSYSFREFVVSGNWRVFVGQNDQKNDQLTFRFAKADDYWFHARGVSGSHVVLKRDGRRDNPGKAALEEAASIAAFYSKAKTSGLVPVSWTMKKFVRKRKGALPGQVVMDREEVLVVPPMEPKSSKADGRTST